VRERARLHFAARRVEILCFLSDPSVCYLLPYPSASSLTALGLQHVVPKRALFLAGVSGAEALFVRRVSLLRRVVLRAALAAGSLLEKALEQQVAVLQRMMRQEGLPVFELIGAVLHFSFFWPYRRHTHSDNSDPQPQRT